ncbi:MAG: phosphate starvation-inducible protein PsiF [Rhodanobacter sp.]|nr:MAG: phosphate starvation-inducible protein PsiF [Rhodanobacter sp.]
MSMPLRLLVISAAFAFAGATFAASPQPGNADAVKAPVSKARTAQQQRMVTCNKEANGKKGAERRAFMSSCLKGKHMMATAPSAQRNRMKSCNAEARTKALKGTDRKTFMSGCLMGNGAR